MAISRGLATRQLKGRADMAVASILDAVRRAREHHQAVPLFVCGDMLSAEGVIGACEATGMPGILGLWGGLLERPGGEDLVRWVRGAAERSDATLSLMLDHGRTVEQCLRALDLGFSDVMYDGSALPLEENLANAGRVAGAARAAGVGVEAELGIVGRGSEYDSSNNEGLTDVESAARFASESGCDVLAVAIGTAHGLYSAEPRLDLDRLRQIRSRVDLPLAVHGGSGLSEEQFRAVIEAGVSKINIGTDLYLAARDGMADVARRDEVRYFDFLQAARDAFRARAEYYLRLFGEQDAAAGRG